MNEKKEDQPLKKKNKKKWILIFVVAAVAIIYLGISFFFIKHYLPKTTINGISCSGKTVKQLEDMIREDVEKYELTIQERGGSTEMLKGADFSLKAEFDDTLTNILNGQHTFAWPAALFKGNDYEQDQMVSYDEAALTDLVNQLTCMDQDQMTQSEDAKPVYSEEKQEFEIQPEVYGTYIDNGAFQQKIKETVISLKSDLDLEKTGCYTDPVYTKDSQETKDACEKMNQMASTKITYDMVDIDSIEISKSDIAKWLTTDENMNVTFNDEALSQYVSDFANKYNTLYKKHTLKTSWGSDVTITKGSYGWRLDQEKERKQLKEDVQAMQEVKRQPEYSRTAKSHTANDYGNTYVEINLTAQHLYFYKDGKKIIDTDFVSGNVAKNTATPVGIYPVTYTQKDATLRGDNYETPVSFWMPFNGGVGMHDATWRSKFGGTIYKTNGSHGCINLPYSAAQTIFQYLKKGDPVLVYELPGTERSSSGSSSSGSSTTTDTQAATES